MFGGAQLCVRKVTVFGALTDQANAARLNLKSTCQSSFYLNFKHKHNARSKSILISCKSSSGSFGAPISNDNTDQDRDDDYVEAFVLISETLNHYRMRLQGFQEKIRWQSHGQLRPFSVQGNDPRADLNLVGSGILRRFQGPTIFLKISCDGDFLLPIIVGEAAVEKLIDSLQEDESGVCPNQFQLVRNVVGKLGYKVKMVRITKRVVNTYFASIHLQKPGEKDILRVDVRPSDAINVAKRCRAPIYVNKQIVLMDATRIAYGMGRNRDAKTVYDVYLDSAADGPDLLNEELNIVKNMNSAIKEERYCDAASWRDKLMKIRESKHEL